MVLFEADPRHADILNALTANNLAIVDVVLKAVFHTSGEKIKFLQLPGEASHVITGRDQDNNSNETNVEVSTIALDDFILTNKLYPELIKVDAEGSEYDILNGAKQYISQYRPAVIFEDYDLRAATYMQSLGYKLINTSTALTFDASQGNPTHSTLNFFAYDPAPQCMDRLGLTELTRTLLNSGPLSQFTKKHLSEYCFTSCEFFYSSKQKLLIDLIFGQNLEGNMKIEYIVNNEVIGHYGGDVVTILKSYTSCPVHLSANSKMQFRIYTEPPPRFDDQ